MEQGVSNFARFYAAFNALPCMGEREDMKCDIVRQYTKGRTESLREMTRGEYEACCRALEAMSGRVDERKRLRSRCLRQMQLLGVDTTDWRRINAFCCDARIAGKVFARLDNNELEALARKLRGIARKGGLKAAAQPGVQPAKAQPRPRVQAKTLFIMPLGGDTMC